MVYVKMSISRMDIFLCRFLLVFWITSPYTRAYQAHHGTHQVIHHGGHVAQTAQHGAAVNQGSSTSANSIFPGFAAAGHPVYFLMPPVMSSQYPGVKVIAQQPVSGYNIVKVDPSSQQLGHGQNLATNQMHARHSPVVLGPTQQHLQHTAQQTSLHTSGLVAPAQQPTTVLQPIIISGIDPSALLAGANAQVQNPATHSATHQQTFPQQQHAVQQYTQTQQVQSAQAQPVQQYTQAHQQPVQSYQQPQQPVQQHTNTNQQYAQTYEQSYQQPAQTYQQPVQTYQQPAQTYEQPAQTYQQPAQTYQQPAQQYDQTYQQQTIPQQQYQTQTYTNNIQQTYQQPAQTNEVVYDDAYSYKESSDQDYVDNQYTHDQNAYAYDQNTQQYADTQYADDTYAPQQYAPAPAPQYAPAPINQQYSQAPAPAQYAPTQAPVTYTPQHANAVYAAQPTVQPAADLYDYDYNYQTRDTYDDQIQIHPTQTPAYATQNSQYATYDDQAYDSGYASDDGYGVADNSNTATGGYDYQDYDDGYSYNNGYSQPVQQTQTYAQPVQKRYRPTQQYRPTRTRPLRRRLAPQRRNGRRIAKPRRIMRLNTYRGPGVRRLKLKSYNPYKRKQIYKRKYTPMYKRFAKAYGRQASPARARQVQRRRQRTNSVHDIHSLKEVFMKKSDDNNFYKVYDDKHATAEERRVAEEYGSDTQVVFQYQTEGSEDSEEFENYK